MNKKDIEKMIKESGLNPQEFSIGTGFHPKGNRYVFDTKCPVSNKMIKYAIKYITDENVFIIWHRYYKRDNEMIPRSVLSLCDRKSKEKDSKWVVNKWVEFVKRNSEKVFVCESKELVECLKCNFL